jgi:hypothetical protein
LRIRLGAQRSRNWRYATDGFLADVRADGSDRVDTKMRAGMFMLTPVAKRMPAGLRRALVERGLWPVLKRRRMGR